MDQAGGELTPALRERVERASTEFLTLFFETELSRKPGNLAALIELGHLYTRLGRIRDGLAIDRRLVEILPDDPTVHYNLACSLALAGEIDAAFQALEAAVERGYGDAEHLAGDEDLAALRDDERFAALVRRLCPRPPRDG